MLYVLYMPDGSIHQANKLYVADEELVPYEQRMLDMGQHFLGVPNQPGLLKPEHWYVDVGEKTLVERPAMPIEVSKARIKCNGEDFALISGIPADAKYRITTSGVEFATGPMDGTEMQIFMDLPCIYRVEIDLWPYRTFVTEIEGAV